jgi:hypothetical protein
MDELTNLFKKSVNISETISTKIMKLISDDLDRIVNQMISDVHTNTKIYSLFENIVQFDHEELSIAYHFLLKNGYAILENKLKQTGLYYNRIDMQSFMDYYTDDIYNYMRQSEDC